MATELEGKLIHVDDKGNETVLYPDIKTDSGLTKSGKAADSKIVGDKFAEKAAYLQGKNFTTIAELLNYATSLLSKNEVAFMPVGVNDESAVVASYSPGFITIKYDTCAVAIFKYSTGKMCINSRSKSGSWTGWKEHVLTDELEDVKNILNNHTHNSIYGTDGSQNIAPPIQANQMRYDHINEANAGSLPHTNNANAILTMNTHGGNYNFQLGFSGYGEMWMRSFQAEELNTTKEWSKILHSGNIGQYGLPFIKVPEYTELGTDPTDHAKYFEELLKWICTNYPGKVNYSFAMTPRPSTRGLSILNIYDTDDTVDGLPKYASGIFIRLIKDNDLRKYGTDAGVFYYNRVSPIFAVSGTTDNATLTINLD